MGESIIKSWRRPRNTGELARAIFWWLEDTFDLQGLKERDQLGGALRDVDGDGFEADVFVIDKDKEAGPGYVWTEIDGEQRELLRAWEEAKRPPLDRIAFVKDALGPLTQCEAAAIRALRAGECVEGLRFPPEEIELFKRNAFLDVLARGVDAGLGNPTAPPRDAFSLCEVVKDFLKGAYGIEAGGGDCELRINLESRTGEDCPVVALFGAPGGGTLGFPTDDEAKALEAYREGKDSAVAPKKKSTRKPKNRLPKGAAEATADDRSYTPEEN